MNRTHEAKPAKKTYRVWLFKAAPTRLAYETDSPEDAEAFADEFNRLEAKRHGTGRIAFADARLVIKAKTKKAKGAK